MKFCEDTETVARQLGHSDQALQFCSVLCCVLYSESVTHDIVITRAPFDSSPKGSNYEARQWSPVDQTHDGTFQH